jgi:hypothetical protein
MMMLFLILENQAKSQDRWGTCHGIEELAHIVPEKFA